VAHLVRDRPASPPAGTTPRHHRSSARRSRVPRRGGVWANPNRRERNMYLFSRLATLRGNERRSLAWAAKMTDHVNAVGDHTVTLWRADFGYPVGTVAWSTWVESMAALNEGFAA